MRNPMRRASRILLCAGLTAGMAAASPPAGEDPFGGALFLPELVIRHAEQIGLDEGQRAAIKEAIGEAQPLFLDRQLELQSELGRLRKVLAPATVDETAALEHLDRILAVEREIKRAQIGLLVRIKNLLRPEQQQRLAALRKEG